MHNSILVNSAYVGSLDFLLIETFHAQLTGNWKPDYSSRIKPRRDGETEKLNAYPQSYAGIIAIVSMIRILVITMYCCTVCI
jgi:hypothetical protein